MRELTLDEKQIMDFDLLIVPEDMHYESHLIIYFILSGEMEIETPDSVLSLSDKDFVIVNPFLPHSVKPEESCLAMKFILNPGVVSAFYDISELDFAGNSVEEESGQHMALRNLLEKCVAYYYGKRSDNGRILLKLSSLYYDIAELLISSFSVVKNRKLDADERESDESLIQEMTRYIHLNYQSPIKLEDLAEHFFLSSAYVSRFFKKKLGVNFSKYLTDIRLDEAVRRLETTDKTLTWIAMDCGFPNLVSFNTAFKGKYNMSPKEYRASRPRTGTEDQEKRVSSGQVEFRLMEYFEESRNLIEDDFEDIERIEADAGNYTILTKNWNKMINIGGVSLLLQKEMQDQIVFLCKTLGFEYVRIWDLYEKRMHINAGSKDGKYNFNRLDSCLDFLTEHNIRPYLELGFKPFILLKDFADYTFDEEREIPFQGPEEYGDFIRKLLRHLINRYSLREVSSWILEVWCDPRWFPGGDAFTWFSWFEQAYRAVKEASPRSRVGGAYDRSYGIISFEKFIQQWSLRNIQPDFFSIYCFESIIGDRTPEDGGWLNYDAEAKKSFHVEDYLSEWKQILRRHSMMMPVYSSEWGFTVINANVMNDSRFKGAYMMRKIINLYPELELMGYWFGTDLFVDEDDAPMLLNGRCGLITHQGICKPAYWAMWMMNRLENYLLKQTENVMVTMDEFDSYVIACHNFRELDIQYYVQLEKQVTIESISHLYENNKNLILKISIAGVRNGTYHIKTRVVNSQYGCVQDEWMRMGKIAFLTAADVEYIDHMSRPHITISEQTVSDHTLRFTVKLEPQEIQSIHAFRYMEEAL